MRICGTVGFSSKEVQYCDRVTYTDSILLCPYAIDGYYLLDVIVSNIRSCNLMIVCATKDYEDSFYCKTGYSII